MPVAAPGRARGRRCSLDTDIHSWSRVSCEGDADEADERCWHALGRRRMDMRC